MRRSYSEFVPCNYCYFPSKSLLLYFQANAPRWLCNKAWGCRFILQRHASGCEHKLWLQLQEEVSLPVAPADLHLVLHCLHPIHYSEHLTVWLQVCHHIITLLENCVCVCVAFSKSLAGSYHALLLSWLALCFFLWTFWTWAKMFKITKPFSSNWVENTSVLHFSYHVALSCHDIVSQLITLPSAATVSSYSPSVMSSSIQLVICSSLEGWRCTD